MTRREKRVQAVAVAPQVLDLVGPAVGLLVALEVAEVAADLALDQRRPAAGAGARDRLAGGLVDGEEVEAVDDHAGHAEAVGALGDVDAGLVERARGGLGVAVVLDHEDARQVPGAREVERLEERALVGAAVAGEGDATCVGALDLGRQADAADERRAAADDAVGAEHALVEVGDVHRAALAVADAGLLAVDLGHHRP